MLEKRLIGKIEQARTSDQRDTLASDVADELSRNIKTWGMFDFHRNILDRLVEVSPKSAWRVVSTLDDSGYETTVFEAALKREDRYTAWSVAEQLGSDDLIRRVAEAGESEGDYASLCAYGQLNDRDGMERVLGSAIQLNTGSARLMVDEFIRETRLFERLAEDRKGYLEKYEIDCSGQMDAEDVVACFELASQYDIVVGVARGGLYSSHLFSRFGADVALCRANGPKEAREFEWLDEKPDLNGKKVLLLDKDVVSGSTLRIVLPELSGAAQVDLYVNHNPPMTNLDAVPTGINQVHLPKEFGFGNFLDGVSYLKRELGNKNTEF